MSSEPIKVIFGTATVGNGEPWTANDYVNEAFEILKAHGCKNLDTAQLYGKSEEKLGELKAGDKFILDTKWLGGFTGKWASKDNIINTAKDSIKKLGVKQVCLISHLLHQYM